MKSNNKTIIVLVIAVIVLIVVSLILFYNYQNPKESEENLETNIAENNNLNYEKYVNILEDGTKLNSSVHFQTSKMFESMEITDIQLTEKDGVSLLIANVKNNTQETKGGYPIRITMLDDKQNEIATIEAYLKELKPGESTQLSTSATQDFANSYDFEITKK